jgi:predicted aminopeptidase
MRLKNFLFLFLIELSVLSALLWNFDLLNYGISQLDGQMKIIWNARPIEEFLNDPSFPDSLKTKVQLINEVKAFATERLGIKPSNNYTTLYDQKGKDILWVITASEPFELKSYEWNFPLLGKVQYKGFFNLNKGKKEAEKLVLSGYDGGIGKVGAWSTLGWFNDPILSGMLSYDDGDLINLIIHELTHGTLFVKDDVEFNENLASFIGDKGAIMFIKEKYGAESAQMDRYLNRRRDEKIYNDYIISGAKKLEALYATLQDDPLEKKEAEKQAMIEKIIAGLSELDFFDKEKLAKSSERIKAQKNAYFMSFIRYNAKFDQFEEELETRFNNDLKAYLNYLKTIYPTV